MTHKVNLEEVVFEHGKPFFECDECYSCFPNRGNGLLFRLVNTQRRVWAFYNDTTDTVMRVRAIFGPTSQVEALQRTKLVRLPKEDGTVDDTCELEATLQLEPGFTEPFIEGAVVDFRMDFQAKPAPDTDVQFEFSKPSVAYSRMYKCFKTSGNGLLFRLIDDELKTWYFYNDTRDYVMHVTVEFGEQLEVTPLGKTVRAGVTPGNDNSVIYALQIEPGATEPFIRGDPEVYKLGFSADPIANDVPQDPSEIVYLNGSPDPTVVKTCSKVYKCFKDHGNGLLFRIVDEPNKMWAFYNDTTEYVMTVNVCFPPGVDFDPAAGVQLTEDDANPGGSVTSMQVPPLATVHFLSGLPKTFEIAFSAEPAQKSLPEASPNFENGTPDRSVIDYTEVFRCFKEHGNGLLFRLVDVANRRWGFYNDTKDMMLSVKVSFGADARITSLGRTTMDKDSEMGVVYLLDVEPLQTVLFVEGDVSRFTTHFTATKLVGTS